MKVIVGLGNPGDKYLNTRHNFGFLALDGLAEYFGINFKAKRRLDALIAEYGNGEDRVILAKPQTFMNNSGKAIKKILNFYNLIPADLLLIYDDLDLPLGKIKTTGKSSAGHKGVDSVISSLKSSDFSRVRLGIGKEEKVPAESYVLSPFKNVEIATVEEVIEQVVKSLVA